MLCFFCDIGQHLINMFVFGQIVEERKQGELAKFCLKLDVAQLVYS